MPEKRLRGLLFPFTALEASLAPGAQLGEFSLFQPSVGDIARAEQLFIPSPKHHIDYLTSAVRMDHAPGIQQPEVSMGGWGWRGELSEGKIVLLGGGRGV